MLHEPHETLQLFEGRHLFAKEAGERHLTQTLEGSFHQDERDHTRCDKVAANSNHTTPEPK